MVKHVNIVVESTLFYDGVLGPHEGGKKRQRKKKIHAKEKISYENKVVILRE